MKNKKVIGIDARFYGPTGKGLGRYTQEIVDRVIRLDRENDYVVFLYKENFDDFVIPREGVKKVLTNARWYTIKEQITLPFLIWREKIDLMHFAHFNVPFFTPTKFVVTIHDLILTKFPTIRASTLSPWLYKIKNLFYKIIIWNAVKRARKIIAVSKYTQKDIIEYFKISPEKVEMVYEGVSEIFSNVCLTKPGAKKVLEKYHIKSPFLLYIGNAYPHKNLEKLILVFSKLKITIPDLELVLVGKADYFYNRLKGFAQEKNIPVVFAGFVPDSDLEAFFREVTCYVFPSFYEGFGLPPLEAMSQGCPVVSSDQSCLPEVFEDSAVYFNPNNEAEMIKAIEKLMKDKKLRQELINRGFKQYKKYSWDKAAEETVAVYGEVLE
jgi:glycosyltransferase involved in cell wall biosynthesis